MNEKLAKLAYQFANLIDDKEIDKRWYDLDNKARWFDFAFEAIPLISALCFSLLPLCRGNHRRVRFY